MPCYDGREKQLEAEVRAERDEARAWALKTTQAACEMAKLIKIFKLQSHLSQKTLDWIADHEKIDRKHEHAAS